MVLAFVFFILFTPNVSIIKFFPRPRGYKYSVRAFIWQNQNTINERTNSVHLGRSFKKKEMKL